MLPLLLSAALASAPAPKIRALTAQLAVTSERMLQLESQLAKTCTDRSEHLGGDGKPEHVFVETARSVRRHGAEQKTILAATEDGRDVTRREQQKLALAAARPPEPPQERGNYGGIDFANPFTLGTQRLYRFWIVPSKPGDGKLVRIHFEPNGEKTSRLNTGEALVDPQTGMLAEISAHPSDYPAFVRFVNFDARYAMTPVGPVRTDFTVEGAGGFLFVQKHYREEIHCQDFALNPAESTLSSR